MLSLKKIAIAVNDSNIGLKVSVIIAKFEISVYIIDDSTNAATSNIAATIPISIAVYFNSFFSGFFLRR